MCVIYDAELEPCPKCGGMVVMIQGDGDVPDIWCTQCETVWVPKADAKDIARRWWNDAKEARAL